MQNISFNATASQGITLHCLLGLTNQTDQQDLKDK